MRNCPECKRAVKNTYLFSGKWYCFECVKVKIRARDSEYYARLYEAIERENQYARKYGGKTKIKMETKILSGKNQNEF